MGIVRILFLADTHLGFDYPFRPRVEKNRRGPDFFANYARALEHTSRERIDCVVHGGDLFFRSKVPAGLVDMAFAPLRRVADRGIPVFIVPGNHERSVIPFRLLAEHPGIHIFDEPRTVRLDIRGVTAAFAGFPHVREGVRRDFPRIVEETGWRPAPADIIFLCMHQCVEGAVVGPHGFMFTTGGDVVRGADIPPGPAAVLSGHIHRRQVLTRDRSGKPLPAPVLYPGSVERTSFAEKDEPKGYFILETDVAAPEKPGLRWTFHELPARPMVPATLPVEGLSGPEVTARIRDVLAGLPPNAVVKLTVRGTPLPDALSALGAAAIRAAAPDTMQVTVTFPDGT